MQIQYSDRIPPHFQKLTPEDAALYGTVPWIFLNPPLSDDPRAQAKRERWIELRAAPYPAPRHSEYLFRPDVDTPDKGPRILLSAILELPTDLDQYIVQMPKKHRYTLRGKKALARGYTAREIITPQAHAADIWEIIHSSERRQNRQITEDYAGRPKDFSFPRYDGCADPLYGDIACGVFAPDGTLVAYLLGFRNGYHVYYDEILGHSLHLSNDVMYLLHYEFMKQCLAQKIPPRCLHYGPWYSGANPFSQTGGLNRWKRKTGFRPAYLILASSSEDNPAPARPF